MGVTNVPVFHDHYAKCDECGHETGTFGNTRGLSKRMKKDGWKRQGVKLSGDTLCPACNPKEDREYDDVECSECGHVARRTVGVGCEVCPEGTFEKQS